GRLPVAAALLVIIAGTLPAQQKIWTQRYDSGQDYWDQVTAVAWCPDNAVVVTGFSYGSSNNLDIATVKMNSDDGEILWSRRWTASGTSIDEARVIAVDDSGNVFVAGVAAVGTPEGNNYVTIRYSPDGNEDWAVQYHSGDDVAVAVVPDGAGGCYVTGHSTYGGNYDYLTIHYDSLGAEAWVSRVGGPANGTDRAKAMVADPAGSYLYVTGSGYAATTGMDYYTLKLDRATGDTLWGRTYDGSAASPAHDTAYAIVLDPDGNVVVTGMAGEQGTWYDATTVKYSPGGDELWVYRFDAGRNSQDCASSIAIDPDGSVICGGFTDEYYFDSFWDFLVFSVRPDGSGTDWRYIHDEAIEDDSACQVLTDEFGNVYACGYITTIEGELDWHIAKLGRQGTLSWTAQHGVFDESDIVADICLDPLGSIYVAGSDWYEGSEYYAIVKYSEEDVGAWRVAAPVDTVVKGQFITPRVWVRNYGATAQSFPVWIGIGGFYYDGQTVSNLPPFDSVLVSFAPWEVRDVGPYAVRCHTLLPGDKDPANDTTESYVLSVYPPGWVEVASMPLQPSGADVKRGGWLTYDPGLDLILAAKGNKTTDFYAYDMKADTWGLPLAAVPSGVRRGKLRPPDKGTLGISDGAGNVYLTSGSSTRSFWKYNYEGDTWEALPDVPEGPSGKDVKGGNSMAFITIGDTGWVYLLKGYRTEFFRFNTVARRWDVLADAPGEGIKGKWQNGSWIVYDGERSIYAHPARYYDRVNDRHYLFKYDVPRDSWVRSSLTGMPLAGQHGRKIKRKKAKDGGQGAYYDGYIYALKGGNTQQFFRYNVDRDSWVELDTVPTRGSSGRKRRVKYGGGLIYADFALWALKGNRTSEFWRSGLYLDLDAFGRRPARAGAAGLAGGAGFAFNAAPNPFVGRTALRYSLPRAGRVRLSLYDAAGRCVRTAVNQWQAPGAHSVSLRDEGLAAGVYLAKLELTNEAGTLTETRKLLLAR
ncbi:hypothetical protein JXB37_02365, partial [candidate division WOR-3 bacterium]|nr:hypothetical protein [candidate division WOR-3 bacterium]